MGNAVGIGHVKSVTLEVLKEGNVQISGRRMPIYLFQPGRAVDSLFSNRVK